MKTVLLLLSLAFLPLFAFSTCTTNTHENQAFGVIYDTEGNPLNKNSRYFTVSAIWGAGGGGVRLANLGDQEQNTCPTSVVQSRSDLDDGISVYFKPLNPKQEVIREAETVNIKFYVDHYVCANLTVWTVDNYVETGEKYTISTREQLPNSVNNRFQIKSLGNSMYKIIFCPHGHPFNCQNVGIADQNGYNRLVLSDRAKAFVFKHDKRIGMAIE